DARQPAAIAAAPRVGRLAEADLDLPGPPAIRHADLRAPGPVDQGAQVVIPLAELDLHRALEQVEARGLIAGGDAPDRDREHPDLPVFAAERGEEQPKGED